MFSDANHAPIIAAHLVRGWIAAGIGEVHSGSQVYNGFAGMPWTTKSPHSIAGSGLLDFTGFLRITLWDEEMGKWVRGQDLGAGSDVVC